MDYGAIYTPLDIARFLTQWAVRKSTDNILDLGIGGGVFVFEAFKSLVELGALPDAAVNQIFGTELDKTAWDSFCAKAMERKLQFPHLANSDFFNTSDLMVDAIIGNPPYVRRANIINLDEIREKTLVENPYIDGNKVSRQSDLYIYFLLHAIRFLKPRGHLAVITADPWLNVGYGSSLRDILLKEFTVDYLVSFDRPIFLDALVKPVMILARKTKPRSVYAIDFVRVKNGLTIERLAHYMTNKDPVRDIIITRLSPKSLQPQYAWGIHFKSPEAYDLIAQHDLTNPVQQLARTQIGIQTLAKEFFVLSKEKVEKLSIEPQYLAPLAQSAQFLNDPIINSSRPVDFFLFYCSADKEDLLSTNALKYIEDGEQTEVPIRGKNDFVIGYQNKDRVRQANRKLWYDLRTSIERRGRAEILIPRLVYKNFMVYWNQATYVSGELFIEFRPLEEIDPEVYLAILNSTLTEIAFRCHAQVYGGGTYNMNSGEIRNVPILNATKLNAQQQADLIWAYRQFIDDPNHARVQIDKIIYDVMEFDQQTREIFSQVLHDLILIATSTKDGCIPD